MIEGPGFRIEKHGRFIVVQTNRTPEEQKQVMKNLCDLSKTLPGSIKEKAKKLEKELSKFNSFDIISHISRINLFSDPETYKEYSQEGCVAFPEYLTLLCLKSDFSQGSKIFIESNDIEKIQDCVKSIFRDASSLISSKGADPDREGPPTLLEELQFLIRLNELVIRNPAYKIHLYEVLENLFEPFNSELVKNIGFDGNDAIKLSEDIVGLIMGKLNSRIEQGKTNTETLKNAVKSYKKTGILPQDDEMKADLIEKFSQLPEAEYSKEIENCMGAWVFVGLGDTLSFSVQELSLYSGLSQNKTKSFLENFSLRFGDIDKDFYIPAETHPLKEKPLIVNEGQYLCPSPLLLDWAIKPSLEKLIKNLSNKTWNRYIDHRHDFLLNKAIGIMTQCIPEITFEVNLEYNMGTEDKPDVCELDGLGLYDCILLLVEAKGGHITQPARRGAPERLQYHLEKLLGEAHTQAVRARDYIDSQKNPLFKRKKDGSTFELQKNNIKYVFLISLTLEPLGHLTSFIHAKSNLDLFKEGDMPWMVNLYDLMVITDLIDYPPMLSHYVKRRIRISKQGILKSHDELDILGYYLKEGLYFESEEDISPHSFINLLSYTTDIDDYYFYKTGQRETPASKPKQYMSPDFENLLNEIESVNMKGKVDVCMMLLDMDRESREKMIEMIGITKDKSKKDNRLHDFSMAGKDEGGWGITYMFGFNKDEVSEKLKKYCSLKKYQVRASRWFGIGDIGEKKYEICKLISLNYPWEYNSNVERKVIENLGSAYEAMNKKDIKEY